MNEYPLTHSLVGLERALEVQSILALVAALVIWLMIRNAL